MMFLYQKANGEMRAVKAVQHLTVERIQEYALEAARVIYSKLANPADSRHIVVVGVLDGAAQYHSAVCQHLLQRGRVFKTGFIKAKSYANLAKTNQMEVTPLMKLADLDNAHVVLLDELCDSGDTLAAVKAFCLEKGARAVSTVAMARVEGSAGQVDYVSCTLPANRWYFGYGLDLIHNQLRYVQGVYSVDKDAVEA